jgi:hypothetical protein
VSIIWIMPFEVMRSVWITVALLTLTPSNISITISLPGTVLALFNFTKPSLVGANTVNGPSPFKVSTNSAALMAVTKVVKDGLLKTVSIISGFQFHGALPFY